MVQTIIQLAHNLGLRPHAEGVEDETERAFLLKNGCTVGQGFLFSTPRPAEEIPGMYVRSRRGATPALAAPATTAGAATAAAIGAATTAAGAGAASAAAGAGAATTAAGAGAASAAAGAGAATTAAGAGAASAAVV